jgi:hypothetical protein
MEDNEFEVEIIVLSIVFALVCVYLCQVSELFAKMMWYIMSH